MLVTKKQAYAFADDRMRIDVSGVKVLKTDGMQEWLRKFAKVAPSIAVEHGVRHYEVVWLRKQGFKVFHDAKSGPTQDPLVQMRLLKSTDELRLLRRAAQIAAGAYLFLRRKIHMGQNEREVAQLVRKVLTVRGAEAMAFPPIVAFGKNSAVPHHHPTERKLRKNEIVLLDFGAVVGGYHSDITRVFFSGTSSARQRRIYYLVEEAQQIGLGHYRAGESIAAADVAVRAFFKKHNVEKYYTHSLGHGIGLQIHEAPGISHRVSKEQKFVAGMAVTVEPGLYIPGFGGVRLEEDVVIGRRDVRVIS